MGASDESAQEWITISTGEAVRVECPPLYFCVRRREVGADGGLSLELYGPREDADAEELIRFDLFRDDPHYHGPASEPKPVSLSVPAASTPLDTALAQLSGRLPELLVDAGHARDAQAAHAAPADLAERLRDACERAPEPVDSKRFPLNAQMRILLGMEEEK